MDDATDEGDDSRSHGDAEKQRVPRGRTVKEEEGAARRAVKRLIKRYLREFPRDKDAETFRAVLRDLGSKSSKGAGSKKAREGTAS